jgi:hypothetical protein
MENGPFIDDCPTKTFIYKGFSMAMLNNQMVIVVGMMDPKHSSIFDNLISGDPAPVGEDGAWGEIRLDTNMSG